MLPLVSMLRAVRRARCRCMTSVVRADRGAGRGVDDERRPVLGGQSEVAAPGPEPVEVGALGRVAEGQRSASSGGVVARGQQRPADAVGGGQHGLAQELDPQLVELALGEVPERADEAVPRRPRPR